MRDCRETQEEAQRNPERLRRDSGGTQRDFVGITEEPRWTQDRLRRDSGGTQEGLRGITEELRRNNRRPQREEPRVTQKGLRRDKLRLWGYQVLEGVQEGHRMESGRTHIILSVIAMLVSW
jgi:hypothetical protein